MNRPYQEAAFRRVLRLLPSGYRMLWEEDMVSAYLSSIEGSPRLSRGERRSVVWLAVRMRLNGSHASPRAGFWYRFILGIAVLGTLYESVGATADFSTWGMSVDDPARIGWRDDLIGWWPVVGLAWAATFACLVLGRLGAARVLILVAIAHDLAPFWLDVRYSTGPSESIAYSAPNAAGLAWLVLTLLAVFLAPAGLRLSRWWLAGVVVPALLMVLVAPPGLDSLAPVWFAVLAVSLATAVRLGTIVGMVVALVRAPLWLLPLAVFGAATAAAQLAVYRHVNVHSVLWESIALIQLALAVACAAVGVFALRRLPRQP